MSASDDMAAALAEIKAEYAKNHDTGRSVEIIPIPGSGFPMPDAHLEKLYDFVTSSGMYGASHDVVAGPWRCMVCEGDIDRYWLSSISNESCRAPFSPTWITSAYALAALAQERGYADVVDVGAGDGRIAFCATLLGMKAHAVEADANLIDIQKSNNMSNFVSHWADAASLDYSVMDIEHPAFFIGGLAQMGGTELASGVMSMVRRIPGLWEKSGWILAGTHAPKYAPDPQGRAGWGTLMAENGLVQAGMITLPAAWTLAEHDDVPYVLAVPDSNPH